MLNLIQHLFVEILQILNRSVTKLGIANQVQNDGIISFLDSFINNIS